MEETNWYLIAAAAGVFFLFIAAYLIIMFLWPEWVGITGKVALEAERSHSDGTVAVDTDATSRWQSNPDNSKK